MANIRFIHDFASDRATLTASSTAGALAVSNMQRNEKAAVWRSTTTTATITATWAQAVEVDSFAMGGSNLTSGATITIRLFALAEDADPVLAVEASPDSGFGAAVSQAQAWFAKTPIEKVEIEISDADNPDGYIEVSRLCIGLRHEMTYNPKYGAALGLVDRSKSSRAESGDVRVDEQGTYRTLSIDFGYIEATDAEFLLRLATRGKSKAMFVSAFPNMSGLKQSGYAFFAVILGNHDFGYPYLNAWSTSVTLEEVG